MKLSHIAEVAALASAHSDHVIKADYPLPQSALNDYWRESKRQAAEWSERLQATRESMDSALACKNHLDEHTLAVLEQVFVWDMLTRVWGAILTTADYNRQACCLEPIARNVFISQLEARRAAMSLMVFQSQTWLGPIGRVDQLRRKAERWTDLLLGHLVVRYEVGDFAFDEARSREFGEQQVEGSVDGRQAVWELILASLRLAFSNRQFARQKPNGRAELLIHSVLRCFPDGAFPASGPSASEAVRRLGCTPGRDSAARVAISASELKQLLELRYPVANDGPGGLSFAKMRRRANGPEQS